MISRKLRLAAGLAAGLSVAAPAGAAGALDKASLRLDWVPGGEHGFVYLGKARGYFADAGIDLEILGGKGSTLSVKLVGNGDNDFAFADATTLVRAWEAGVPLVVLHVLYEATPTVIMAKKSSGIGKIGEVCGHKMGVNIASTTYVQFKAMLAAAGVTCAFEEVPTSGGGLNELMAGAVDAIHTYTYIHPVLARMKGVDVVEFAARDYFSLYSQTLITSKAVLGKGDLAARFRKAALKSLDDALAHPEAMLEAFGKANPEANIDFERAKFAVVKDFLTVDDGKGGRKIGAQTLAGWQKTIAKLQELGAIKGPVDPAGRFVAEGM